MSEPHDLDPMRAEQAARDYFAGQAGTADFEPLDPAPISAHARRRRWTGIGLAAAACLVAVLVITPLALRHGPPSAPVAAIPEREFAWTPTAEPPLSPRFGSLTAWIEGKFYVLGGWEGGPCPPGAMCKMAPPTLRDAARYDPAGDTWEPVTPLPVPMGVGYTTSVVVGGQLYVASFVGEAAELLAYDAGADSWRQVAAPPVFGRLVGLGDALAMVVGGEAAVGYNYRPESDDWIAWGSGPLDACTDFQGFAAGDRVLVLAGCGETQDTDLQVGSYHPATGMWSEPVPLGAEMAGGDPLHTGGSLVWPDSLTPLSSSPSQGIFDTGSGTWREVDTSQPPGPLAYREVADSTPHLALDDLGLVTANGRLLEVATAEWVDVPDLPGPERWASVVAGGPASLLNCFGYAYDEGDRGAGEYDTGCYLLS